MPCIITTVHDPLAIAAVCRRLNLPVPEEGCVHLDDREASGWIVRLPGVRFAIVCDTLTGLIAYHPGDNAFGRYAQIMRFVYRVYAVQTERLQASKHPARCRPRIPMPRRSARLG